VTAVAYEITRKHGGHRLPRQTLISLAEIF